jgi:asparagine synthase (glutamine-hydrolysing)
MIEQAVIALGPLWQALPSSRNSALGNRVRQLRKFAHAAGLDPKERYWQWASFMPGEQARDMLLHWTVQDEKESKLREARLMAAIRPDGDLCDVLHTDLHMVLRNDMLTKVDLMSMANSLEVRVPFLDHRLVSYVNTLPAHYRIRRGERKRLLRDAFRDDLPQGVFNRPKHGFEVPLLKWFRTELRTMITDELLSPALIREQGIFVPERIKELTDRVMGPDPGDSTTHIWNLIVFQRWWLRYMKK